MQQWKSGNLFKYTMHAVFPIVLLSSCAFCLSHRLQCWNEREEMLHLVPVPWYCAQMRHVVVVCLLAEDSTSRPFGVSRASSSVLSMGHKCLMGVLVGQCFVSLRSFRRTVSIACHRMRGSVAAELGCTGAFQPPICESSLAAFEAPMCTHVVQACCVKCHPGDRTIHTQDAHK